jgi:hypothetical protein
LPIQIVGVFFDDQSLRLDFGVSRLDERKSDAPLTARRYPVCCLVLPPAAAIDLINKMQQIAAALTQAGLVKTGGPRGKQDQRPSLETSSQQRPVNCPS